MFGIVGLVGWGVLLGFVFGFLVLGFVGGCGLVGCGGIMGFFGVGVGVVFFGVICLLYFGGLLRFIGGCIGVMCVVFRIWCVLDSDVVIIVILQWFVVNCVMLVKLC